MASPTVASIRAELHAALESGAYFAARGLASRLPRVELIDSLRITLLAARHDPARFDVLARDWIGQAIKERALGVADLRWVVPQLHEVGIGSWRDGEGLVLMMRYRYPQ